MILPPNSQLHDLTVCDSQTQAPSLVGRRECPPHHHLKPPRHLVYQNIDSKPTKYRTGHLRDLCDQTLEVSSIPC